MTLTRRNLLKFSFIALSTLPFGEIAHAADSKGSALPLDADTYSRLVLQGLTALANARTSEERTKAYDSMPLSIPFNDLSYFSWLGATEPWHPFLIRRFTVEGKTQIIPSALGVLEARISSKPNGLSQREKESDIILIGSLLAAIGEFESTRRAIPAFLKAVYVGRNQQDYGGNGPQFISPDYSLKCLVTLCGIEKVETEIAAVLHHPDPLCRAAAVCALCVFGFRSREVSRNGRIGTTVFAAAFKISIPQIINSAVNDPDRMVRMVAWESLLKTTRNSETASWSKAIALFPKALRTPCDDDERLSILRVLARIPYDTLSLFPAFRSYLISSNDTYRGYSLMALYRLMQVQPTRMVQIYVDDINSTNHQRRKKALLEIEIVANILWGYSSSDEEYAEKFDTLFDTYLFTRRVARRRGDPNNPGYYEPFPKVQHPVRKQFLLSLRNAAIHASDPLIRLSAARSLTKIAKGVDRTLYSGAAFEMALPDTKPLHDVLQEVADTTRENNPTMSEELSTLAQKVITPHSTF